MKRSQDQENINKKDFPVSEDESITTLVVNMAASCKTGVALVDLLRVYITHKQETGNWRHYLGKVGIS